jgi:pimeloyl-ACP methyl ester carboxylesterase
MPDDVTPRSAGSPTSAIGNKPDRGGHFAALEQPEVFVNELRSFFGGAVTRGDVCPTS